MIKKVTKNNYRKYYKEYYNIEFGIDMEVHHIDFNRDNNNIKNLLLIPKNVHHRFHLALTIFQQDTNKMFNCLNPNFEHILGCSSFNLDALGNYLSSLQEIQKWIGYKCLEYNYCQSNKIVFIK